MPVAPESSRRGFMKLLAASPLLAQIAAQGFYTKSATAMGLVLCMPFRIEAAKRAICHSFKESIPWPTGFMRI